MNDSFIAVFAICTTAILAFIDPTFHEIFEYTVISIVSYIVGHKRARLHHNHKEGNNYAKSNSTEP